MRTDQRARRSGVFTGFLPPLKNLPEVNTVDAGRPVTVKFALTGDTRGSALAPGFPVSQQVTCTGNTPMGQAEVAAGQNKGELDHDPATGTWVFVWKTRKEWADTCRVLHLRLLDGLDHQVRFHFR